MRKVDRRVYEECEIRSNEAGVIEGYAAVFDSESENLGGFREVVRRTAFDRALKERQNVVARGHHRSEYALGTIDSGHLKLEVDERGLKYTVTPVQTTTARDTAELIRAGIIKQSSFAFSVPVGGDRWEGRASDGLPLRELVDVDLVDVAPVIGPAYEATVVSARSAEMAAAASADSFLAAVPPDPGVPNEINAARLALEESAQ